MLTCSQENHDFAWALCEYFWQEYRHNNSISNAVGLFPVNNAADVRVKIL